MFRKQETKIDLEIVSYFLVLRSMLEKLLFESASAVQV